MKSTAFLVDGREPERRKTTFAPRRPDPEQPLAVWEFFAVVGACVLVLAALAEWVR